jgi:thiamine kinase-like enzyme
MSKFIFFKIIGGSFNKGFIVNMQIFNEEDRRLIADIDGTLPPSMDILSNYEKWQDSYRQVVSQHNIRLSLKNINITSSEMIGELKQHKNNLYDSINEWLFPQGGFVSIWTTILTYLNDENEEIRFIFKAKDIRLKRLPLFVWEHFFEERYHRAEMVLYLPPTKRVYTQISSSKVKILAVLSNTKFKGNETQLKIEEDWRMLKDLLADKSNAEIISLSNPNLEQLADALDYQRPQILFFAGHSWTDNKEEIGKIQLADEEFISIEDLKHELIKAVKTGLKLAIFNSCDGIGIAEQLYKLQIPNVIVMREPLPDRVAHKFLQRFLEAFAAGKPLHHAVRRAREKLNRLERDFPGVTWLPMIWQSPSENSLTWESLGGITTDKARKYKEEQISTPVTIEWLQTRIMQSSVETNEQKLLKFCHVCGHKNSIEKTNCECCYASLDKFQTHLQVPNPTKVSSPTPNITNYTIGVAPACISAPVMSNQSEVVPTQKTWKKITNFLNAFLIKLPKVDFPFGKVINNQTQVTSSQPTSGNNYGEHNDTKLALHQPTSNNISVENTEASSILAGRYRIAKVLARGGFSQTYLAQDTHLPGCPNRVVKQMITPGDSSPESSNILKRLFETEMHVLSQLGSYDTIPQLFECFEVNNTFYIIEEFIDGINFTQEIASKIQNEYIVISILKEVLLILELVHKHNIIHRDIKPSNIIRRSSDNKLVLIDFGAAKQINNLNNFAADRTVIIGTVGYASPEQMRGHPRLNSDIFSLGMIGIYALTGVEPHQLELDIYERSSDWKVLLDKNNQLTTIIDKMIEPDPSKRYQTATEVLNDLNLIY